MVGQYHWLSTLRWQSGHTYKIDDKFSETTFKKHVYLFLLSPHPRGCISFSGGKDPECVFWKKHPPHPATPSPTGWFNKCPSPQPCFLSSGNCFAEKLVFSLPNVIAQKVIVRKMWLVRAGSGRLSEAPDALSSALGGQMAKSWQLYFYSFILWACPHSNA